MTTIGGLPAHVLLVHAVVVLVPLTALLVLLVAFWPAARRRLWLVTAALAVVTLVLVPLTTQAGEWLERHVPTTALVRAHTELGDDMLPWAVALAAVALAVAGRELLGLRAARRVARVEVGRGGPGAATSGGMTPRSVREGPVSAYSSALPGGTVVTVVVAVLAVVVSLGAVYTVYEIGDSGSRAAWTGRFSPTPLARPGHRSGPSVVG